MVKYLFPPWYVYALARFIYRTVKGIFWMPFKIAAKFDAWWKKLAVFAGAVYIAIPGSIPYAMLQLAKLLGYEEEAQWVIDTTITVAKAAWSAGVFAYNLMA